MFHRKDSPEEVKYTPMEDNTGRSEEPKARIQKIHQEGSKSTYVIIVNKDCLKSDSALRNIASNVQAPVTSRGRSIPRRALMQDSNIRRNLTDISDKDFDSPVNFSTDLLEHRTTAEDVKLNLTGISDEQYDSGLSSSSVFLKSDRSDAASDSAVDTDLSQSSHFDTSLQSAISKHKTMNSYVIPSPLGIKQKKNEEIQHAFPVISSQVVNSKSTSSKLAYNTPVLTDKIVSHQAARKIFLVPETSAMENAREAKKTIHYTSQAVPVANKTLGTPVSVGYQRPVNPNAVPVFSDISPIQAAGDNSVAFLPVQPSPQSDCTGDNKGPLTSTPIGNTNPRIAHLKQESSTHRAVYIIPSPFNRRKSDDSSPKTITNTSTKNEPLKTSFSDISGSGQHNNSSGFVSTSNSLEQTDNSTPIQITDVRSLNTDVRPASVRQSDSIDAGGSLEGSDVITEVEGDVKLGGGDQDTGFGTEVSVDSSQESVPCEKQDKGCLNRSLTNIQWLKGMQLKEEKSQTSSNSSSSHSQHQTIQWKCLSPEEIKQISEECGREKRPPFSYMSLIQMALYSREDRKMMLKEICKWIEDTFPYYRYCGKQGWKNSIRHNLSLYNIFEREPAKRHGAYWTIKPNLEPKTKQYKDRGSSSSSSDTHQSLPSLPSQTPGMIPIIPMYSSMGQLSAISPQSLLTQPQTSTATTAKKKGPQPILPRPSPYGSTSPYAPHAYALIPLQNVSQPYGIMNQGMPHSPVIVSLPTSAGSMSACPSPVISEMSAAVASIQVSCASPIPPESCENPLSNEPVIPRTVSIVREAWIDTQSMDTCSSVDSDLTSSNDVASSNEYNGNCVSRANVKRPRDSKPGLPKPKIYHQEKNSNAKKVRGVSKRRKLQLQERALQESSDEDDDGTKFLSKLEKDLTTPLKLLATSDDVADELLATSTPFKNTDNSGSPQLPSPIRGLTPLKSAGLFDGSFLDIIDHKSGSPDLGAKKYLPDSAIKLSPNTSIDFNVLDKCSDSPDSNTSLNNQNLSRFLNEFCIDPNLAESAENFPSLNWSVVQQMVDNMETDQN